MKAPYVPQPPREPYPPHQEPILLVGQAGTMRIFDQARHDYHLEGTITAFNQFVVRIEARRKVVGLDVEDEVRTYYVPWNSICYFQAAGGQDGQDV